VNFFMFGRNEVTINVIIAMASFVFVAAVVLMGGRQA